MIKKFIGVYIERVGLAWHGRLFRNTHLYIVQLDIVCDDQRQMIHQNLSLQVVQVLNNPIAIFE